MAGYEAALFLRGAAEKCGGNALDGPALGATMEGMAVTGPRGRIEMDGYFHATSGDVFVREFTDNGVTMVPTASLATRAISNADRRCKALSEGHLNRWTTDYWQS